MQQKNFQWLRLLLVTLGFCLFTPILSAQQLTKDKDYAVIDPPVKTSDATRIEVTLFFSYACNHCNDLHPVIVEWAKQQPKDVAFRPVAIPGSQFYTLMSKAFFALDATGQLQKFDTEMFNAIHQSQRPPFNDATSLAKWITSKGGDGDNFLKAFNSFGVDGKSRAAGQLFDNAGLNGVPAIVVDGRYHVLSNNVKSFNDLMIRTDKVIAMRRAELNKGKK